MVGAGAAFVGGVAPFVIGGVAKSVVAAALVRVGKRTRLGTPGIPGIR
jgi:biotin transporter BioY